MKQAKESLEKVKDKIGNLAHKASEIDLAISGINRRNTLPETIQEEKNNLKIAIKEQINELEIIILRIN